ncbi:putative global transcription activator SNF2L2 [Thelohanellus kitauei]|uniref:Putative global transcription activator SNF2L2 n=1 Tax=Thelohanellus kitauei TaxID=669202 RepID=A0A0C2JXG8_THEKT|nr:putative global transcription activator SNF2L2 [Thelohanellus kitauei]
MNSKFFSPENIERIKEIVKELKVQNDPNLSSHIESLENLLNALVFDSDNQHESQKKQLDVYLDQNSAQALKSTAMLLNAIVNNQIVKGEPLHAEFKEAYDFVVEYLQRSTTQHQIIDNPPSSQSFYEQAQALAPAGRIHALPTCEYRKMRDVAVIECMKNRMRQLETILPQCQHPVLKTKGLIEYRALELSQFQGLIRERILSFFRKDKAFELAPNLRALKKPKRLLDDFPETVGNYQKMQDNRRSKRFSKEFLSALHAHCKEFKEFHRSCCVKTIRSTKMVSVYHANHDRERRKEEERMDRERIRRLMMEDEEGYRKLLDEKKDHRIHYLLNQTDEFIKSIMDLVSKHKELRLIEDLIIDETEPKETKIDEKDHYANDDADLVFKNAPTAERPDSTSYYKMAHTIGEEITGQPSILEGGQLKEYQIKGLEWMVSLFNNKLNGILADEMGLGKTIQTIAFFAYLMEFKRIAGPHIVVVPLSTISNWQMEFQKWCPKMDVLTYKGPQTYRRQMAPRVKTVKFNILLTTYEFVMKDKALLSKVPWKYMVVDEGHRMKNQDCKLTLILTSNYKVPYRLLLTGTPLQNRLPELWALLNFLLPNIFNCCTTFEQWFNAPFANTGERVELNEEETYLIIRRLHKILRPFLLRRLKKEVEAQLPEKVEYVIKCHMSSLQKIIYHLTQNNIPALSQSQEGSKGRQPRILLNTLMQLRKVCNHPFLFPQIEESMVKHWSHEVDPLHSPLIYRVSGKFELMDRILPKLKSKNHRCLIFCQMTQLMSILEDYLNFSKYMYLRLDGSTKSEDRAKLLDLFNAENSPYFIFILSTRAGGLGLNLQSADTVILFDSDWNPQQDLQAQDRAHRIGQKNEVRVLRLITANSIEERILAAARFKLNMDEKVIQAGMFNQSSTSNERKAFLEALLDNQNPVDEDEGEVPDDDTLNQMISRSEEEYESFQKMDDLPKTKRLIEESEIPEWIKDIFKEYCNASLNDFNPDKSGTNKTLDSTTDQLNKDDNSFDGSITSDSKGRKRRRRGFPERLELQNLQKVIQDAVNHIKNYDSEGLGKAFYIFYRLPTKKQLPHYYTIISNPIDVYTIERKNSSLKYRSWREFTDDMNLMVTNALKYNTPGSQIHQDAILLGSTFKEYCQQNSLDFYE